MTAPLSIYDVIQQWQGYFAALPGVRSIPSYAPDGLLVMPMIVVYPRRGVWTWGPDGLDPQNKSVQRSIEHTVWIELHVTRNSLDEAQIEAARYLNAVPDLLLLKWLTDTRWGLDKSLPASDNLFPMKQITCDGPLPLGWAGQSTFGYRWTVEGVLLRSAIS